MPKERGSPVETSSEGRSAGEKLNFKKPSGVMSIPK